MDETAAKESVFRRDARLSGWRMGAIAVFSALVAFAGLWSMPPLDRDEARFAQATAQMLETGDYINIRFQQSERNKKPAGIYWLQAASVSAFSNAEAREIWAYRLPSVAGAILASIFTYIAGARLFGPSVGFLAAMLLASAPGLAGEATIAKTDAALLATICMAQAAFIHIYANVRENIKTGWGWPILLWIALGAGILIKGPIAPMVTGLTGVMLLFRKPHFSWIKALRPVSGVILLVAMVAPWAIAIDLATEGRFFAEAIGGDMLGKVGAAQESHSGPIGYYFILVWILFWPAAALLAPAAMQAFQTRALWPTYFLLAWIIPTWIFFEITATKLPHYTLPLYPAVAILAARAAAKGVANRRKLVRRFGAGIYLAIGFGVAGLIAGLPLIYGAGEITALCFASAAIIALSATLVSVLFWRGRSMEGAIGAVGLSALLAWTLLNGVLPQLDRLKVSPRLSAALDAADLHPIRDGAAAAALTGYYEPSAVFLLGTDTVMTTGAGAAEHLAAHRRAAAAVEARNEPEFLAAVRDHAIDVAPVAVIDGLNYSNGTSVSLTIYARTPDRSDRTGTRP